MQPPPRKGNYAKFLKNLHTEQLAKLQLKNQHECDLLEDIRSFTIKRSAIEKSYSEALLKISSAYLNKKIPNIPDIKLEGGEEKWNMWNVWRVVLEENEKLAKARLAAVEVFQQQIADEAKVLRTHKLQTSRKCIDQLGIVQKELQTCVQDVDKTKKLYFDEEHSAHDVRDKAKDLEEKLSPSTTKRLQQHQKLKKKKGSFFQSITSLQKNSAKFSSKRDQLEEKSAGARNDYLLCLAAANAHQNRYFVVDLQLAMSTMESQVYEKVAEYLTLMGRTELLTCSATQNSFGKIRDQAQQLTREYNLQCCYLYYPVLKQHIQYDFEPCDNDPIDHITAEQESAAAMLSKEARRWATKIARETNSIRENVRKLQLYNALREAGQKVDPNDPNGPDLETKIDELRQTIRRSETTKMKAEARIECLRNGGVNVDEWMQEAETLSVQDIPRSASSLSVRTDASGVGDHPSSDSFYDSDINESEPGTGVVERETERQRTISKPDSDDANEDSAEVDAMLEQQRQKIEQLTAGWDDPTAVDWGSDEPEVDHTGHRGSEPSGPVLKCTALYSYTAQNPDELSIVENEQLEVVGEGDGDGWLRARNYRGEEGFVPHNYLDVERDQVMSSGQTGLVQQISFSSVDYTMSMDHEDDTQVSSEQNQSPEEQISVISVQQVQQQPDTESINEPELQQDRTSGLLYCIALYDYDGDEGELSFEEGQIIRILNKCAHGVDDGWWEGEMDGQVGNFPSLVVEECDEYGEPLECDWDETPPCSAPPVFTPPDAPPGFFLATEVIVTQATPMVESKENEVNKEMPDIVKASETDKKFGFAMELTQDQHDKYGSQFQSDQQPMSGIPCVVVEAEDENGTNEGKQNDEDFGLGVAQIVITAATPMVEEPEHPFPPPAEEQVNHEPEKIVEPEIEEHVAEQEPEEEKKEPEVNGDDADEKSTADDQPTDSAPFPISSSSEGETTGPSTAENSQSHAPPSDEVMVGDVKLVVGGRASIPDELEPHQLARLQDLKESNA